MKSQVFERFHKNFKDLGIGDTFQMVNSVMGAVVPKADVFEKISNLDAIRIRDSEKVTIRKETKVQIIKSSSENSS